MASSSSSAAAPRKSAGRAESSGHHEYERVSPPAGAEAGFTTAADAAAAERLAALRVANEYSITQKLVALLSYTTCSFGVIVMNKSVYKYFDIPLLSAWLPQLGCVVTYLLWCLIGHIESAARAGKDGKFHGGLALGIRFRKITLPLFGRFIILGSAYSAMLYLNNVCLKTVPLSVYQVTRSLTLIFNLIGTRVFLAHAVPLNTLSILGVVCVLVGFGTTASASQGGKLTITPLGLAAGIGGSLTQVSHGILAKKLLAGDLRKDDACVTFYTGICASIFLGVPLYFQSEPRDWGVFAQLRDLIAEGTYRPLVCFIAAGACVIITSYMFPRAIRIASPLSLNIMGFVKSAGQIAIGILIFREAFTARSLLGVFTTLAGSVIYMLGRRQIHTESTHEEKRDVERGAAADDEAGEKVPILPIPANGLNGHGSGTGTNFRAQY